MHLDELQYNLPPERIAQHPVEPRDSARLLVLHRDTGQIDHRTFHDIGQYLHPDDCLILNDTRVIPARFFCQRPTGGRIEALFLHEDNDHTWRVMLRPSARLKPGEQLSCQRDPDTRLETIQRFDRGEWSVRPVPPQQPLDLLQRVGQTPLPPYIHRNAPASADIEHYQTVYAIRPGAVAAPTAGLHFTPQLLNQLESAGIRRTSVTLHVGPGTFVPIQCDNLAEHPMHAEWYEAAPRALDQLRQTRAADRACIAVGTTSVRVLESLPHNALNPLSPPANSHAGWTDIFIYPPYTFRHVDRLITNFHLPGSTLLALVMAFATPDLIRHAYHQAIAREYRFYSYGDAMLIL